MRFLLYGCAFALTAAPAVADDWPQWLGPQRDGVWRETGILDKFPEGGPKLVWRVPVGIGYSGPAVAAGKVYVTDYKLATGQTVPETGFAKPTVTGAERVLCLDEKTGAVVWKHQYPRTYRNLQYASGSRTT